MQMESNLMNEISTAKNFSAGQYTMLAITLHWVMALLIIGLLVLGYYMVDIPKGVPDRASYFNLHKSFGLLAAIMVLMRIGWRLVHPAPPLPGGIVPWTVKAAGLNHLFLYLCMVLQPLTGYLSSSFNKYGVKFFGIELPRWAGEDANLRDLFMVFHHQLSILLIALIVLHVLAALKHLLLDRDRIFQRMLPGR
jgi:cytochrome b561